MAAFGGLTPQQIPAKLPTPCYLVNTAALRRNLSVLQHVQEASGAKILLALKGFAMWGVFDQLNTVLHGVAASSVNEAQLGREMFGGEVHAYAPAYSAAHVDALLPLVNHINFNSLSQWRLHRERCATQPCFGSTTERPRYVQCGLRVNPEHSEVAKAVYDPCAPGSRLGVTAAQLAEATATDWEGLSGLHFHTLCELGSDALERTLKAVEAKFGRHLHKLRWVNFGGGHHITRPDYDVERLIRLVSEFRTKYGVEVYLEPGEAVALNTGVLVTEVLDVSQNGKVKNAILDTSASAHMPDVLEGPYRPEVYGAVDPSAADPETHPYVYRLGGLTCLAGDVVGDYAFARPLVSGDRLVLGDMAHYSMVKNTTFNGVNLPSIAVLDGASGAWEVVRSFGYEDYKSRLS